MRKSTLAAFGQVVGGLAVCALALAGPAFGDDQTTIATQAVSNDAWLARAAKLYYSSRTAGFDGFDCAVHPDWQAIFVRANNGAALAPDDWRVALLGNVNIVLHGRLNGTSTLEWISPSNPTAPEGQDPNQLLASLQKAMDQTITGFMQFWSPFMDGTVIPASPAGLTITPENGGYRVHADATSGTAVTEIFDEQLVLRRFETLTGDQKIVFEPTYDSTSDGMLVSEFLVHIGTTVQTPEQAKVMHIKLAYRTVDNARIPAEVDIEVVGIGVVNVTLDRCTVLRTQH